MHCYQDTSIRLYLINYSWASFKTLKISKLNLKQLNCRECNQNLISSWPLPIYCLCPTAAGSVTWFQRYRAHKLFLKKLHKIWNNEIFKNIFTPDKFPKGVPPWNQIWTWSLQICPSRRENKVRRRRRRRAKNSKRYKHPPLMGDA